MHLTELKVDDRYVDLCSSSNHFKKIFLFDIFQKHEVELIFGFLSALMCITCAFLQAATLLVILFSVTPLVEMPFAS